MPIQALHIADLYSQAAQIYADRAAFATRQKGGLWKPVTFRELFELGSDLANALAELGVGFQDKVGLLADNRLEWILTDCACQLSGAVDVPRGSDITPDEIVYILNHCEAQVCFVENLAVLAKVQGVRAQLSALRHLVLMNPDETAPEGVFNLAGLVDRGRALRAQGQNIVPERVAQLNPEHLFTLIYTSGTTGGPKGVMLTHANMVSQITRLRDAVDISPLDRILSILPVWHIFERLFEMYTVMNGCCTYYTNVRNIGDDLRNVRPTFMGSAPRLWESIYKKILANVEKSHPVRQGLFHIAYFLSRQFQGSTHFLKNRTLDLKGRPWILNALLYLFHLVRWVVVLPFYGIFNASVLERLRLAAGGDLKASISGGGALPRHIDEFFNFIGIPVLEGYGMTETSPVLACRTRTNLVIGTVGPIFPDTELRIVDVNTGEILYPDPKRRGGGRGLAGEIHVRGPQVMKGYYKEPEATARVIQDGWMNTGDLGLVTFNDCLKISGRTKDTIVLTSGENVDPIKIENRLLDDPFIDRVMVTGQDQKFLTALILPSAEEFAKHHLDLPLKELAAHPEVRAKIEHGIKGLISTLHGFKIYETIQDFRLIDKPFEVGDEITSLSKLRRHAITARYQHLIDDMYKGQA